MSPLCRGCGRLLDQMLRDSGEDYHPTCKPTDPNEILGSELLSDLTDVIKWTDNNSARSMQTTIGPSELGSSCDRRIAYRLAGTPEANWWSDPLPAIVGTAVHTWLESAVKQFQSVHYMDRWVTEITVTVSGIAPSDKDDLVLATAKSAAAEYVVTGDEEFQSIGSWEGVQIVSPRQFLDILRQRGL